MLAPWERGLNNALSGGRIVHTWYWASVSSTAFSPKSMRQIYSVKYELSLPLRPGA